MIVELRKMYTKISVGIMVSEMPLPNLAKILKVAGLDFVILDCEHGAFDYSQIANFCAVANAVQLLTIIRIPNNGREVVLKMLDMGADGLLLPMVNAPEILASVVKHGKYPPIGKRGLATTRAHSGYYMPDVLEYLEQANKRTMIFGQLETLEGLDNCPEILSLNGVDGVFVGPNDLSVDMGIPGEIQSPLIHRAIDKVVETGNLLNKQVGIISSNDQLISYGKQRGVKLFSCGSEVGFILKSAKNLVESFKSS